MKIAKNKYAQKVLVVFALSAVVFLSILTYVLGWLSEGFELTPFLIFLAAVGSECVFFGLLYFLLQKINNSYYLIESNNIRLIKKNQEICVFELKYINNIHYIRFFWALLMQFGAGYLMIDYTGECTGIKPDIKYPDGEKLYGISMSAKQVKGVSKILNINIPIK